MVSHKLMCPACQARLKVARAQLPAQVTCPRCRQVFQPPGAAPPADDLSAADLFDTAANRPAPTTVAPPTSIPKERPVSPSTTFIDESTYGVLRPPEPEPQPEPLSPTARLLAAAPVAQDLTAAESSELIRQLLAGFQGQVVQRRPTWGYRLAALGSAVGLCLLMLVYAATLLAIPVGLWWYVTRVVPVAGSLPGRLMFWSGVLHVALAVGLLGFLYALVRPLFRWHGKVQVPLLLRSSEHPVLYAFVTAIARQVGAPVPHQIHLQPQANATAIRQGRQLQLSLGGPLFLGLDLKSMAGVIAHELGHFSQTGASWISRFVRRVTHWLVEAVGHTEAVTESVADVDTDSSRMALVLAMFIRFTLWLGWMYLLALAAAAIGISRFLMRRQEFDADRYEIQIAGSAQFAVTMRRLAELNAAEARLIPRLLEDGDLDLTPANFSGLVVAQAGELDERARRQVGRELAPQSASWWDSHPSPADRIAAAAQLQHPGIVQLEGPASCLLNSASFARMRFGR